MEVRAGYKQTEVGVIPEEWDAAHIGDVCSFSGGSQPPRSTFKFAPTQGYIRLIQIRDYKSDDFASYIPEPLARKRCTSEDIMIGRYGPPVFQILRGIEGAYNVALIKAMLTPKVDREFFFNVLNQDPLFQLIEALSRRSSGQTGVEMPALKAYGLPLPTIPEQRAIATALSDVDALLGGLDRLIAKKRDLKQAAMQQLLTGQTRLPGFYGEWEVKRVLELGDVVTGGTPRTDVSIFWGDGYPWITPTDISAHRDMFTSERSITRKGLDSIRALPPNTVLVTCIASIGKNAIIRTAGACNQQINAVTPNKNNCSEFLYYVFEASKQYLQANAGTTATSIISKATFAQLTFTVPPIAEQIAIAQVLTEMDTELSTLEQRREKTRALKQAMMQELLTGRTRLL